MGLFVSHIVKPGDKEYRAGNVTPWSSGTQAPSILLLWHAPNITSTLWSKIDALDQASMSTLLPSVKKCMLLPWNSDTTRSYTHSSTWIAARESGKWSVYSEKQLLPKNWRLYYPGGEAEQILGRADCVFPIIIRLVTLKLCPQSPRVWCIAQGLLWVWNAVVMCR